MSHRIITNKRHHQTSVLFLFSKENLTTSRRWTQLLIFQTVIQFVRRLTMLGFQLCHLLPWKTGWLPRSTVPPSLKDTMWLPQKGFYFREGWQLEAGEETKQKALAVLSYLSYVCFLLSLFTQQLASFPSVNHSHYLPFYFLFIFNNVCFNYLKILGQGNNKEVKALALHMANHSSITVVSLSTLLFPRVSPRHLWCD